MKFKKKTQAELETIINDLRMKIPYKCPKCRFNEYKTTNDADKVLCAENLCGTRYSVW